MKKIKKLWDNNRVMFVLATIVIICFIIMGVVVMNLFFGVNTSPYGNRLNDIQNKPITEEIKSNVINKLKENDVVDNVSVRAQGKIVYIRIQYQNVSLERAKEIAASSLELFTEEYLNLYDIHYTIVQEKKENQEAFTVMGSRNIHGSTAIVWNNNTPFEESTDGE